MADQWFIARNNKKFGPYSMQQLRALATQGQLAQTDMLLKEGTAKWVAARSVKGLFTDALKETSAPKRVAVALNTEQANSSLTAVQPLVAPKIQPASPPKEPFVMAVVSFFIPPLGQLLIGQTTKAIVLFLVAPLFLLPLTMLTLGFGLLLCPIYNILAAVDAYLLTRQLQMGQPIGAWQFFSADLASWGREQFRTNPQRVLLAGGGAALGVGLFLCLGCTGVVSLISGGNQRSSITDKFGVEPESNDSTFPDESEYKKLIVGKWKNVGDDIGVLSDVIDEYTADGRINIWDAKDGAIAGRGKYQFLSANKVHFKLFDSEFGDYTATIRISGNEMTFTFEDGKSSKHRRVGGDAGSVPPSLDVSRFSTRAKNAVKIKPLMRHREVEQLIGKPDVVKRTPKRDTLWLYYANPQRGAEEHAVEIVVGFAKKDPNRTSILWVQDKLLFAGNTDYRQTGGLQVGPWKDD